MWIHFMIPDVTDVRSERLPSIVSSLTTVIELLYGHGFLRASQLILLRLKPFFTLDPSFRMDGML